MTKTKKLLLWALKRLLERISKSNDNILRYKTLEITKLYENRIMIENNDYISLKRVRNG